MGRLQLLGENLTCSHQFIGLLLSISFLRKFGQVLDVNKAANLLIEEQIKHSDLHEFLRVSVNDLLVCALDKVIACVATCAVPKQLISHLLESLIIVVPSHVLLLNQTLMLLDYIVDAVSWLCKICLTTEQFRREVATVD